MTHHCFASLPAPSVMVASRDWWTRVLTYLRIRGTLGASCKELGHALEPTSQDQARLLTNRLAYAATSGEPGAHGCSVLRFAQPRKGPLGVVYVAAEYADQVETTHRPCATCGAVLRELDYQLVVGGKAERARVCPGCQPTRSYQKRREAGNAHPSQSPKNAHKMCRTCCDQPWCRPKTGLCPSCGKPYAPEAAVELDGGAHMSCQGWL